MIKVAETTVVMEGELAILLLEVTELLNNFYNLMKGMSGEEKANKCLADIGKAAIIPE